MKKLIGTFLVTMLVFAQTISVFAAGSKPADVTLTGDSVGKYAISETFGDDVEADVLALINDINSGKASLDSIAKKQPRLAEALAGKSLLTPIFDLSPINGGIKTADGKYLVQLSVPTLTSGMSEIAILYYSTERNEWVTITPKHIDWVNKILTIEFPDLGPVAIIGKKGASIDGTAAGTSPKTGVESTWMLWIGAAVVLFAGSATALKKTRS